MQRQSGHTPRIRATAVGLTLLAHVAALLFLAIERRTPRREPLSQLQFVSLWPEPARQPQQPMESEESEPQAERTAVTPRAPVAITLPRPVQQPDAPEPATPQDRPVAPRATPRVDWNSAADRAAARVADEAGKPDTFGPPLQALPEPCVPRVFDKETRKLMNERFPERPDPGPVGPNPHLGSMIVGGRPMAVQKITIPLGRSEPRGDLFENMDEKRKVSSVPSPHFCD